jgi:DNA mismatch repair ATPase MutS
VHYLQVELHGDDIRYTRTIAAAAAAAADSQDGSACRHYGVLLARTAGLPQHITDRAMQVCSSSSSSGGAATPSA